MEIDLQLLCNLLGKRTEEIAKSVSGTGYLPKTVIGVGTFLLDHEGNIDLLTAKQRVVFDAFIRPLLERASTGERTRVSSGGEEGPAAGPGSLLPH